MDDRVTASVELTGDGSQTLRHPLFGETYHSLRGAAGESEHVFIRAGLEAALAGREGAQPLRILEMGLGTGLNCLLTARRLAEEGIPAQYTALELYPVPEPVWSAMDYAADPFFNVLHLAPWDVEAQVAPGFTLKKMRADLALTAFDTTFDLIYMDAFAPDTQPELWTVTIFEKLYTSTAPDGILVTYCAKGAVRRTMQAAGYAVERLPGALGKRHMLRGVKR